MKELKCRFKGLVDGYEANFKNQNTLVSINQKQKIKCRFKNITNDDLALFKKSECLLLVSVGQEAHEGERFKSTIDLINKSFQSCTISLYDSIQRYTMSLSSDHEPDFFHDMANAEGSLWLQRNQKYLDKLDISYQIKRWDEWLAHLDYAKNFYLIQRIYKSDQDYQEAFNVASKKYITRFCKQNQNELENSMIIESRCKDYLMEECAVLSLWATLGYAFEVYPNPHNEAIEATRVKIIKQVNKFELKPITLRFTNAGQLKPQHFILLKKENSL